MWLGKVFARFARFSPVSVMMRGILEYALPAKQLDVLFKQHHQEQYEDDLLFSTVVNTLGLVVHGVRKSVNAAYLASQDDFIVSVNALYDKLQGVETQVSQAVVARRPPGSRRWCTRCGPSRRRYCRATAQRSATAIISPAPIIAWRKLALCTARPCGAGTGGPRLATANAD